MTGKALGTWREPNFGSQTRGHGRRKSGLAYSTWLLRKLAPLAAVPYPCRVGRSGATRPFGFGAWRLCFAKGKFFACYLYWVSLRAIRNTLARGPHPSIITKFKYFICEKVCSDLCLTVVAWIWMKINHIKLYWISYPCTDAAARGTAIWRDDGCVGRRVWNTATWRRVDGRKHDSTSLA